MKYFVTNQQRNGTCYHEFYPGVWDRNSFWKADSILLHDDLLLAVPGFADAVAAVIPSYDPFGETEITPAQWTEIGNVLRKTRDASAMALYREANDWAETVFPVHGQFTILGI